MRGFRVWSNYWKKYAFDAELYADGSLYAMFEDDDGVTHHENTDLVLEFKTGLIDKNGKKIYEGDIVRFDDVDVEAEVGDPATVVYENGAFLAKCSDGNLYTFENGVPVVLGFVKPQLFKVIGNIHENPELLEGKE